MVEKQPVPKEERHEPVPNIDHLLVNVGRTPGDNSGKFSNTSANPRLDILFVCPLFSILFFFFFFF